jgi:DNA-binding transcriptional LysR family regulator
MDRLQHIQAFIRVVEAGSFTAAAVLLNTTTGVVSRAVSDLEAHLQTRLLNRSTRRLSVTEAGQRFLASTRQILEDLERAEAEARNAQDRPWGMLRVHSYASIGYHYVLPVIARYKNKYPEVMVELTLLQKEPDLFEGTSDVAVVVAPSLPDSELVAQHLGSTYNVLCTSPQYLQQKGTPATPSDLANHDCLVLQTPGFPQRQWSLEGPEGTDTVEVTGSMRTNVAESLIFAVREGMGIASVPVFAAVDGLQNGSLVRVLPDYVLQRMNIYAIFACRRYVDAKIRTWVDLLRATLPSAIARDHEIVSDSFKQPVREL